MAKKKLLIYSGGMDSTTLLYDQQNKIGLAVTFDYGSNHNDIEYAHAVYHTNKLGIKHIRIDMREVFANFKSGLLNGADAIPEGHYEADGMKTTVVPFRNGIMLSIAAGLAESNGLNKILLASHAGDHAVYPDCREEFNHAMNQAIMEGSDYSVSLEAPYSDITKREIAHLGHDLGIEFDKTWSCYKANSAVHCGRCSTCVERIWALRGIDTTRYEGGKDYAISVLKESGEWPDVIEG